MWGAATAVNRTQPLQTAWLVFTQRLPTSTRKIDLKPVVTGRPLALVSNLGLSRAVSPDDVVQTAKVAD